MLDIIDKIAMIMLGVSSLFVSVWAIRYTAYSKNRGQYWELYNKVKEIHQRLAQLEQKYPQKSYISLLQSTQMYSAYELGKTPFKECSSEECSSKECSSEECSSEECSSKECSSKECSSKECSSKECSSKECSSKECSSEGCLFLKNKDVYFQLIRPILADFNVICQTLYLNNFFGFDSQYRRFAEYQKPSWRRFIPYPMNWIIDWIFKRKKFLFQQNVDFLHSLIKRPLIFEQYGSLAFYFFCHPKNREELKYLHLFIADMPNSEAFKEFKDIPFQQVVENIKKSSTDHQSKLPELYSSKQMYHLFMERYASFFKIVESKVKYFEICINMIANKDWQVLYDCSAVISLLNSTDIHEVLDSSTNDYPFQDINIRLTQEEAKELENNSNWLDLLFHILDAYDQKDEGQRVNYFIQCLELNAALNIMIKVEKLMELFHFIEPSITLFLSSIRRQEFKKYDEEFVKLKSSIEEWVSAKCQEYGLVHFTMIQESDERKMIRFTKNNTGWQVFRFISLEKQVEKE